MVEHELSSEKVKLAWNSVWDQAKEWQVRSDTQDAWEFAPGSQFAGDNKRSKPYQTSHVCRALIHAATDHQHAIGALVKDAHALHTFADATLARAAIEVSSLAIWILAPRDRNERVLRTLRWCAKDYSDQLRFEKTLGSDRPAREALEERFAPAALKAGASLSEVLKGVQSSEAVRSADAYAQSVDEVMRPLFYWQLMSGFAHGRRWSTMAFAERQESAASDAETVNVRFSMSEDRVLQCAMASEAAIKMAVDLWEVRAARAVPPKARERARKQTPFRRP